MSPRELWAVAVMGAVSNVVSIYLWKFYKAGKIPGLKP